MTTADPGSLPAALRERVLEAARQARAAGRPAPEVPDIPPAEAFRRAAAALDGLLSSLDDTEWSRPVLRDLDVQGLVGHLAGVEEDMQRALAGDQAVAGADHAASTQPAAERQRGRPPARTRAEWRRAADRTLALADTAGDPGAAVALHGMRLPLGALLVVRAFELWTHDNDIRKATGRQAGTPDAATLRQMTTLAAAMLPVAAAVAGLPEAAQVHLVLTGPGGGTWDVAMGEAPPDPVPLTMVTDAIGFCRLAANRLSPGDLDVHVTGEPARAAGVLAAVAVLALD